VPPPETPSHRAGSAPATPRGHPPRPGDTANPGDTAGPGDTARAAYPADTPTGLTSAQDPPTVFLTAPPSPPTGPGYVPPPPPPKDPEPAGRRSWPRIVLAVVVAAALLGLAFAVGRATGTAPVQDTAAPALPSRPTMIGQVLSVRSADTVTVRVADQTFDVSVLGLDAPQPARPAGPDGPAVPAECGADAGIAYASDQLIGRQVTLVPDPTVDEFDQQGRRLAYLVLRTEQNYTDQALVAGIARASTERPLWYSDVLAQGETTARAAGAGIWGFPCNETR
ncbi:MAG: thermonuclease family protein, partial [Pseudonocardia sediminis]